MPESDHLAITLAHRLRRSDQVLFQNVGGEGVLLDLSGETYFGLNKVGTRVWELLLQRDDLAAVHQTLCDEFDAMPATIERDLLTLAAQLAQAGLVTVEE
ncbi:PqqD family protein [Lysobacter niabensis]|uniref:PqqD family protein n=1 Tax=Agrilutibacter niabensis TaxID=380628 RepID=UPI0036222A9C